MSNGTITIKTDVTKTCARLDDFAYSQIPYATAVALTRLAKLSQSDLRDNLKQYFKIRNQYVERGISFSSADKKDWPQASSEVGSRAPFMSLQALGGTKRPTRGKYISLPESVREGWSTAIKPKDMPSRLMSVKKKPRPFITTFKSGKKGIVQRMGEKRYPLQTLWVFEKSAEIKERWPLQTQVENTLNNQYDKVFGQALSEAIARGRK